MDRHTRDEQYRPAVPPTGGPDVFEDDEISLQPLLRTIWSYRRAIGVAIIAIMGLFVVLALAAYMTQPAERIASVEVRLVFDGVDKGEYPNGTRFSTAEIVSTPVLTDVYEANQLERYLRFEDFRRSVFVLESNSDLEQLAFEYQTKLGDPKLTPVDRTRIEEEFRQKRESLGRPQYAVEFRQRTGASGMPRSLMDKVVNDVLAVWAEQAAERKGAVKYNIAVYSRNILQKDFVEAEDYVVAVDILRSKVRRIIANIGEIEKLPGAAVIRTGKDRISLAEVRANLDDVLRFKLQPIVGMIRATGLSKDPRLLSRYLENQLFQIGLDREEAAGRVRTLQESLRAYMMEKGTVAVPSQQAGGQTRAPGELGVPALIPQFGESFFDRLVEMSSQNTDVKYRQELTDRVIEAGMATLTLDKEAEYYRELMSAFKGLSAPAASASERAPAVALIKARSEQVFGDIVTAVDQVNAIYQELSAQNLNPRNILYRITGPFSVRTERAFSLRTAAVYAVLVLILSVFLVPLACLIHSYFRRVIAVSPGAERGGGTASPAQATRPAGSPEAERIAGA